MFPVSSGDAARWRKPALRFLPARKRTVGGSAAEDSMGEAIFRAIRGSRMRSLDVKSENEASFVVIVDAWTRQRDIGGEKRGARGFTNSPGVIGSGL